MNRRLFLSASAAWGAFAQPAGTRESFLRMLARPKVALAPVVRPLAPDGEFEKHHFSFASDASQRVPGIRLKPKGRAGRVPVVVALHGTGGNKEGQLPLLRKLAAEGFLAIAIDGRYHGERSKAGKGSADYSDAMLRVYRGAKEYPFLYDTAWDILRLVDWLETVPDADPSRIGMIGFSKGGMELYLAAAADPRIQVAVPCIGVQSFRWALDNNSWHSRVGTFQSAVDTAAMDEGTRVDAAFIRKFYDRVVPGIYSEFDGPRMVPLIAPRPLLVINGDSDARTPMGGLKECLDAARQAYQRAGAVDRFETILQPNTGHKVNPEALQQAIGWFRKWMSPT